MQKLIETPAHLEPGTAEWLERERGISIETSARCGVVTINNRPAFEFRRASGLQYRKIRITEPGGEKRFQRDRKGVETCLFLEDRIETNPDLSSPLVITEGEIDALSCVEANIANVASVPDGAQLDKLGEGEIRPREDSAFSWLWEGDDLKPHLKQFDRVVLCVDDDAKGRVLAEELAVRFERWKCAIVKYPAECKDANDVLLRYGSQALRDLIDNAVDCVPSRLAYYRDIPEHASTERYETKIVGLRELQIAFVPPELVVVTGSPGSGKSELCAIVASQLTSLYGLRGAILQFEDRTARTRDMLVRYAMANVDGLGTRIEAREWVNQNFLGIEPEQNDCNESDFDLEWLKTTIREARTRHGCRWVIIDPWNEIEHVWQRHQNETTYINNALRQLKKLARVYGLILFVVQHPSISTGSATSIADMNGYSAAGSAAWFNKADHLLIVHRPDPAKTDVHIKLAKAKDQISMGTPGIARLRYRYSVAKYELVGMGAP